MSPEQIEAIRSTLSVQAQTMDALLKVQHPDVQLGLLLVVASPIRTMFASNMKAEEVTTIVGALAQGMGVDPTLSTLSNSMAVEPADNLGVETPRGIIKWGLIRQALASKHAYEASVRHALELLEHGKITDAHKTLRGMLSYHKALDKPDTQG